jgi:uncharacterized protein YjdB
MRRIVLLAMAAVSVSIGLQACGDKLPLIPGSDLPVDSTIHAVTVSPESVAVKIGSQVVLAASVNAGAWATDRAVVWSSSSPAIASVDANGRVTPGNTTGLATIFATSRADTSVKGRAKVVVTAAGNP